MHKSLKHHPAIVLWLLWPAVTAVSYAMAGMVAEPQVTPAVPQASAAADPLAVLVRKVRAQPEDFSYLHLSLAVAREIYPDLDSEKAAAFKRDLDALAAKLKKQVEGVHAPEEIIARANALLFGGAGLKCAQNIIPEKEDPDLYFPHATWEKRNGVCLGLSLLYLAVGEKSGLPVYGAHAPQHIFVRYDDGRTQLNIESTDGGRIFSVEEYLRRMRITDDERARVRELYFKNISKVEVLGDLLNAAAWCSAIGTAKRPLPHQRAVLAAELCVEISPIDYNNWDTLAQAYLYAGRPAEALVALEHTLRMKPPAVGAYDERYWADRLKRFRIAANKEP